MKTVVHRYRTSCYSVGQPPGFCDFVRGTSALYQLSRMFDFKLIVDFSCHPLKDFIKPSGESVPPPGTQIFESFNNDMPRLVPFIQLMTDNNTYCVMSHNFPNGYPYGGIDLETKLFVRNSVLPRDNIREAINDLKKKLDINNDTAVL